MSTCPNCGADLRPLAYSIREAPPLRGLGREQIRHLAHNGEIRERRSGRRILVPHSALIEYAESAALWSEGET